LDPAVSNRSSIGGLVIPSGRRVVATFRLSLSII